MFPNKADRYKKIPDAKKNASKKLFIYMHIYMYIHLYVYAFFGFVLFIFLISGIIAHDKSILDWSSLFLGALLSNFFWKYTANDIKNPSFDVKCLRMLFVLFVGLALYLNLVWVLFRCGFPVSLSPVGIGAGGMAEIAWFGSVSLSLAVISYYTYRWRRRILGVNN
jgi:hypothetical protein